MPILAEESFTLTTFRQMRVIFCILSLLTSISLYAQTFEDIKDQEILADEFDEYYPEKSKLFQFVGKDFDSTDIIMLSDAPILEDLLMDIDVDEDSPMTYGKIYTAFLSIKGEDFYSQMKSAYQVQVDIQKRPVDLSNWEEDKKVFLSIGLNESILEEFKAYLEKNSSPEQTYGEAIIGFEKAQAGDL